MTMIEKVAAAIYAKRNGRGALPWSRRPADHKAPYLIDARAAIEVIRLEAESIFTKAERKFQGDYEASYEMFYNEMTAILSEPKPEGSAAGGEQGTAKP